MKKKLPPKKTNNVLSTNNTKLNNTLLVDGNALYKRGFIGARDVYNSDGNPVGGVYQFLTVLRKLINDNYYHKVYVFWDGNFSGKLRWELYSDYKSGRGKDYINGTQPDDPHEIRQRMMIFNYLEELYIRQLVDEIVEADDFIAYYCKYKRKGEKITIATSDRDLCQLINDDVNIYLLDKKSYVNVNNFNLYFKYNFKNTVLMKVLCGDSSDSIKGIKRLGEDTLIKHFPEICEKEVTLPQVFNKTKLLQEERINNKKKPLQVFKNILECITDGVQGDDMYEINYKIVDLSEPLLTTEAITNIEDLMDSNLSDDRSIKKVYKMLKNDGLDTLIGETRFDEFLLPYKKLIEREKKNN